MSEKIKQINKEEIGEMEIPNDGNVWEANWTDDIDAKDKKMFDFQFYKDEVGYQQNSEASAEAENMILDFEERRIVGKKGLRLAKMAKDESLRKAA